MSIALERVAGGIGRPGSIVGISRFGGGHEPADISPGESCSSSIGRNSDSSGGGSDGGDESEEVQSTLKGPLDTMDALQDSLQITRSISKFYCGKSKSFTSLTDALPSSCAKDLAKPENSYTRKRKNLIASSTFRDNTLRNSLRNDGDAGVSKRLANSRRTMACRSHQESSSSGSNSNSSGSSEEDRGHNRQLPPLHPHGKLAARNCSLPPERLSFLLRSFSSPDLEGVASLSSSLYHNQKRFH